MAVLCLGLDRSVAELQHRAGRPSIDQIELAVAEAFGVDVSQLSAKRIKNNDSRVAAVYLIRKLTHDSAGAVDTQTNPAGIKTRFEYDAVGRQVTQIMNCTTGTSSSSSSSSSSSGGAPNPDDTDVTIQTAYNADALVTGPYRDARANSGLHLQEPARGNDFPTLPIPRGKMYGSPFPTWVLSSRRA